MTGALYGLGRLCVRRRRVVIAVWVLVLALLAIWTRALGPNVTDNLTLPGSDSQAATDLLEQRFPAQANGTNPAVMQAPAGHTLDEQQYAKPIADAVAAMAGDPDVRSATSPLGSKGAAQLSKDRTIGYIALNLRASPSELTLDDAHRIVGLGDTATRAGLAISFGGYLGQKVSKPETHSSEAVGLTMAVLVLLFTFGTVVAMGLPIVTAIFGLVCGLSIITLLSHVTAVPTVAPTLATMIGLGVGIDYALFVVTRHLEHRRDGMDTHESAARAAATSGGAVVFAGCTVMIALLSLAVVGIPLVTTLGYTSALVVAVAVIAAVTLLPALLGVVGDRIDSLRLPLPRRSEDERTGGWYRWGEFVARHPVPAAVTAVVVLLVLALPAGPVPGPAGQRRAADEHRGAPGL
jgi:RND superfamily putative drug exporter